MSRSSSSAPTAPPRWSRTTSSCPGSPGTFSIELAHGSSGKLRISAALDDSSGKHIGRASGTVLLDGRTRTDVQLRATRLLDGLPMGIVAGVPGGPGDRDGQTGIDPSLPARLDDPIAFTLLGHSARPGDIGYILQGCGSIRRLLPIPSGANQTDLFLPCSSHLPQAASGPVSSLSLEDPTAMVADPYGHPLGTPNLYIADGARIVAIAFPGAVDAPASGLTYTDFTALAGVSPMHISAMAIGPYQESMSTTPVHDALRRRRRGQRGVGLPARRWTADRRDGRRRPVPRRRCRRPRAQRRPPLRPTRPTCARPTGSTPDSWRARDPIRSSSSPTRGMARSECWRRTRSRTATPGRDDAVRRRDGNASDRLPPARARNHLVLLRRGQRDLLLAPERGQLHDPLRQPGHRLPRRR